MMAVKLLVQIAVVMMAPAAFRRHWKRGGESPPPSSSSLTFSLDGRRVSPLVHGLHGVGEARAPPRLDLSLCLSLFMRSGFCPSTVSPAYASSLTPPMRRGALLFSQASSLHHGDTDATEADMDDIITTGSAAAAAASPGFTAQDDTMDLNGNMDGELDYGEEEPGEEEEEPALTRKGRKKKRAARTGEPRVKWASKEDECRVEAWKIVCLDPITGTNQNVDTYWERIKSEFDERKLIDPYFKGVHMQHSSKAMANHWAIIQTACNKWHGIVEEIAARPESGANIEGQMVQMFAMYRQDSSTDADFKYLHVFSRIKKCEKWAEVRCTLAKAKETYKPDAPPPGASDGRPDGNKRAKTAKDAAPATARLQESIEHCIADAQTRAAQREEKTEARWSALMTNNAVKIDLLQTNVIEMKRNTTWLS